jgi:hypothetical protein
MLKAFKKKMPATHPQGQKLACWLGAHYCLAQKYLKR